jgi:hypothetical protein
VDLHLYLRVLWRFRVVVLCGLLLAPALAFFSFVSVSPEGAKYRQSEEWASYARLLVRGPELSLSGSADADSDSVALGDQLGAQQAALQRYTALAIIYSRLADSDAVLRIVRESGPVNGTVEAAPVTATERTDDALPIISIAAISDSPTRAISLARREVAALQEFLAAQQRAEGVRSENRVSFTVVKKPTHAVLLAGRSITLPIVVFLTVLIAVIGLAFVLENLRPRVNPVRRELLRSESQAELERHSA